MRPASPDNKIRVCLHFQLVALRWKALKNRKSDSFALPRRPIMETPYSLGRGKKKIKGSKSGCPSSHCSTHARAAAQISFPATLQALLWDTCQEADVVPATCRLPPLKRYNSHRVTASRAKTAHPQNRTPSNLLSRAAARAQWQGFGCSSSSPQSSEGSSNFLISHSLIMFCTGPVACVKFKLLQCDW